MAEVNKDITYTDTSTNTPTSYDWDFGDGTTLIGTTQNPVLHKYVNQGTFTVTHKAYNACGPSTNSCTKTIVVGTGGGGGGGGGSSTAVIVAAGALIGLMMIAKKKS